MFLELFLFAKKMKFLTNEGGIHCIFRSSLGILFYARGHSSAELTKHDNSATDIKVPSMYIYHALYHARVRLPSKSTPFFLIKPFVRRDTSLGGSIFLRHDHDTSEKRTRGVFVGIAYIEQRARIMEQL